MSHELVRAPPTLTTSRMMHHHPTLPLLQIQIRHPRDLAPSPTYTTPRWLLSSQGFPTLLIQLRIGEVMCLTARRRLTIGGHLAEGPAAPLRLLARASLQPILTPSRRRRLLPPTRFRIVRVPASRGTTVSRTIRLLLYRDPTPATYPCHPCRQVIISRVPSHRERLHQLARIPLPLPHRDTPARPLLYHNTQHTHRNRPFGNTDGGYLQSLRALARCRRLRPCTCTDPHPHTRPRTAIRITGLRIARDRRPPNFRSRIRARCRLYRPYHLYHRFPLFRANRPSPPLLLTHPRPHHRHIRRSRRSPRRFRQGRTRSGTSSSCAASHRGTCVGRHSRPRRTTSRAHRTAV